MHIQKSDARALFERGYVVLSGYDRALSERAQTCFRHVVRQFGPELQYLSFEHEKRPDGTYEPDDGFIDWTKGTLREKDTKYIFHYRPDLHEMLRGRVVAHHRSAVDELLDLCTQLYLHHAHIALQVCSAFDALNVAGVSLRKMLAEALLRPAVTSRSVLRLLSYPPTTSAERAKVHFDRSFLTLHGGDRGGSLYAVHNDGREEIVSPKDGELLVFWGCKARHLSRRHGFELHPLAHGSKGHKGEGREAVVSFWHSNEELWDADPIGL